VIAPDAGIVVLTGAGISRESGLATFRDPGGIWSQVRIEDVATPAAFARDPARVHAFYNARRRQLTSPGVAPNAAHAALADLERAWRGAFLLVTQNVDDLHERAGSERLVHMHGDLRSARCNRCHAARAWRGDLSTAVTCPSCGTEGAMRPDVVWFGEMPRDMDRIEAALSRCGLFVSIGTSGAVYPAAGFVAQVRGRAHTVELNLERSDGANQFDEGRYGPATETVSAFVKRLRSGASS
jgi:NAD-dependent deacetylase